MVRMSVNLQDSYLNQVRRENLRVVVELLSGNEIEGRVTGFDSFTVVIEEEGRKHLIYKHAIATVSARGDREREVKKRGAFNRSLKEALTEAEADRRAAGARDDGGPGKVDETSPGR